MKKNILLSAFCLAAATFAQAQFKNLPKDILNGGLSKTTSSKTSLNSEQIIAGLKEALTIGSQNGTQRLSAVDVFLATQQ